jgi:hypothetical protein
MLPPSSRLKGPAFAMKMEAALFSKTLASAKQSTWQPKRTSSEVQCYFCDVIIGAYYYCYKVL